MSKSIKASITPELRKFRSESKKGKPHPHRGGFQSEEKRRKISEYFKGKSRLKTEFGRKFKEHYNIMQMDDKALYAREYHYYRKHGVCSCERLNSM